MRTVLKSIAAVLVALLLAGPLQAQVVVSSKIDTEGALLGNIISISLKAGGIPVTERLQLGPTPIVRQAIQAGQIDIYPEYTGNGAFFFNDQNSNAWKNAKAGYERVKSLDAEKNKIVWLAPSPANNTWAIALRQDLAKANNIKTMSDFGRYVKNGGDVKLAASTEFITSPAALPAFQKTYEFILRPHQLIALSGGDTSATIAAAARRTSGANAAMVYGTDGAIAASDLVVLNDDKSVQPVYLPTPIIRQETLAKYPRIPELLKPIFESLTLEKLQALNGQIQVNGVPAAQVAEAYLRQNGFLK